MNQNSGGICAQISFVSEESVPNAIALLEEKPDLLILVSSTKMRGSRPYNQLRDFALSRGTEVVTFGDEAKGTDLLDLGALADEVAKYISGRRDITSVSINLTGGPKTMTIVFMEFAKSLKDLKSMWLYIDTDERVIWRSKPSHFSPNRSLMQGYLSFEEYLYVQGYEVMRKHPESYGDVVKNREKLTFHLAEVARDSASQKGHSRSILQELLTLFTKARVSDRGIAYKDQYLSNVDQRSVKVLEMLTDFGLLGLEKVANHENQYRITFQDVPSARYIGGAWLEEFAWLQLSKAAQGCKLDSNTVISSAVVVKPREGSEDSSNEIDVLCLNRNKMLFVECKSGAKPDKEGGVATSKLADLTRKVGGRLATSILVASAPRQEIPSGRSTAVKVFAAEDLFELERYFTKWLTS